VVSLALFALSFKSTRKKKEKKGKPKKESKKRKKKTQLMSMSKTIQLYMKSMELWAKYIECIDVLYPRNVIREIRFARAIRNSIFLTNKINLQILLFAEIILNFRSF